MIKIENVVLPSPEQWKAIIFGARNPHNSWDKSDSEYCHPINNCFYECKKVECEVKDHLHIGQNDHELMMKLAKAGTDHRKFMRMIDVYLDITAPLYWWKEFDTYKVGTVANSCSTMHKIHAKEFTIDDFSTEHLIRNYMPVLEETINALNSARDLYLNGGMLDNFDGTARIFEPKDKAAWWQMIQLLPSSYNQKRTVKLNYEVLANIHKSRRGHKLDCWREFCSWIETLPYSELITGE